MINRLSDFRPVESLAIGAPGNRNEATASSFAEIFAGAVQRVEASGKEANAAVERFVTGEPEDIHSVALASQRASLEFDYLLQVRNKVVQAYQEVMRMQL